MLGMAPWAIAAIGALAAGLMYWQLGQANQKIGSLEQQNDTLTETLKEKNDALTERARIEDAIRRLPPDGVRDRLR